MPIILFTVAGQLRLLLIILFTVAGQVRLLLIILFTVTGQVRLLLIIMFIVTGQVRLLLISRHGIIYSFNSQTPDINFLVFVFFRCSFTQIFKRFLRYSKIIVQNNPSFRLLCSICCAHIFHVFFCNSPRANTAVSSSSGSAAPNVVKIVCLKSRRLVAHSRRAPINQSPSTQVSRVQGC